MVELPDRSRVICLTSSSTLKVGVGGSLDASARACNFDSAVERSSAWTSLFGGPSFRISHPCGGEGGGEMKNSLSEGGSDR